VSNLRSRLLGGSGFVLLYGTTPPRSGSAREVIETAAGRLAERVRALPLDGFVVYDLQDESARTAEPRPFPFAPTVDSRGYSRLLGALTGRAAVCYKCIGRMTETEWWHWLGETSDAHALELLSLVGRPSSRGAAYAMPLAQAYRIAAAHAGGFTLGGVTIAERHGEGRDESRRMLEKAELGCRYFVSQTVYHPAATIRMLSDYARACRELGRKPSRIVLTFAPCGRQKTMDFMKWLGIAIPPATEQAILRAPSPLARSIEICRDNLREILSQDYVAELPLGVNTESVSINKDEIDASIDLFQALKQVLDRHEKSLLS
jgi:5,10-methylenetetrahydrofolate reductase